MEIFSPSGINLLSVFQPYKLKFLKWKNPRPGWSKEQEKRVHSQEATQHAELVELKVKCAEFPDVVTLAAKCEYASVEKISNLEANLCSQV